MLQRLTIQVRQDHLEPPLRPFSGHVFGRWPALTALRVFRAWWLITIDQKIEAINTVSQLSPRGKHSISLFLAEGHRALPRESTFIVTRHQNHDALTLLPRHPFLDQRSHCRLFGQRLLRPLCRGRRGFGLPICTLHCLVIWRFDGESSILCLGRVGHETRCGRRSFGRSHLEGLAWF